jgi:hypothetical protein
MSKVKGDAKQMQLDLDFKAAAAIAAQLKPSASAKVLSICEKLDAKSHEKNCDADEKLSELYSRILKSVEHIE